MRLATTVIPIFIILAGKALVSSAAINTLEKRQTCSEGDQTCVASGSSCGIVSFEFPMPSPSSSNPLLFTKPTIPTSKFIHHDSFKHIPPAHILPIETETAVGANRIYIYLLPTMLMI